MSDGELLTGPQMRALLEVMEGGDYTSAALAAGVSRETVSRWANGDTPFSRERRRRTDALWGALWIEHEQQVHQLVTIALSKLEWLMRGPDYLGEAYDPRVQLAATLAVLRLAGVDVGRRAGLVINNNLLNAQQVNAERED